MANTPVNLEEFLQGYKKSEVILGEKKWVFREPKMKDIGVMTISEILENYCIEGDWAEFNNLLNELSVSRQKELLSKILQDLGLELMPLNEM